MLPLFLLCVTPRLRGVNSSVRFGGTLGLAGFGHRHRRRGWPGQRIANGLAAAGIIVVVMMTSAAATITMVMVSATTAPFAMVVSAAATLAVVMMPAAAALIQIGYHAGTQAGTPLGIISIHRTLLRTEMFVALPRPILCAPPLPCLFTGGPLSGIIEALGMRRSVLLCSPF